MSFDVTQPLNTTKVRNLGTVIRPNWVAIEDGAATFRPKAINLQNRTPLIEPNDPAFIANTSMLYVKDDATGKPELYTEDALGNIQQYTQGPTVLAAADGEIFIPGGLRMKWGSFTAGATTGTVTFVAPFLNNIYQVQITAESTGTSTRIANVRTLLVGSFQWLTSGATSVHYWVALGN